MKSKTSFFNGTLLWKNVLRFSPIWITYLVCWTVALPLLLGMELFNQPVTWRPEWENVARAVGQMMTIAGPVVSCIYGVVVAMAVFSYLYTARSVSMLHSLPIRRSGLFATNYVSGLLFLFVPNLVVAVLTALVTLAGGVFCPGMVLSWFLGMCAMELFFFSFAALIAMFTGHLLALPVFYAIFNGLCYVLYWTITTFIAPFLYGMSASFGSDEWVIWLTPLMRLYRNLGVSRVYEDIGSSGAGTQVVDVVLQGGGVLAIYAAVGVILAALAYAVYRCRRSETAGDVVAVGWAKVLFRYGVALTAAFSLGQGLYYLLFDGGSLSGVVTELICMALVAAVGFWIAQMLLNKSFRVLKKSVRGTALCLVVILAVFAGAYFDVTGYTRRIPDASQVQQVEITVGAYDYSFAELREEENIEKVLAIHQYAVEHRRELETIDGYRGSYVNGEEDGGVYGHVDISYTLKNGSVMYRTYSVLLQEKDLDAPETATGLVAALTDSTEYRAYETLQNLLPRTGATVKVTYGHFSYFAKNGVEQVRTFSQKEYEAVYAALLEDAAAGRMPRIYLTSYPDDYDQTHYVNELWLDYQVAAEDGFYGDYGSSMYLYLTADMTSTIAALEELGILGGDVRLTTYAESRPGSYDDDVEPYYDDDEPIFLPADTEENKTVAV